MKRAFGLLLLLACLINSAHALSEPQKKLDALIRDFVVVAHPEWQGLDIRITYKFSGRLAEQLKDVSDNANLEIVDVYHDLRPVGNVIFPVQINDKDRDQRIFVRAQVEVFKTVVIATRMVKRGETIGEGDLALEARDIAMLPDEYYEDKVMVVETEAKTTIPKNGTIFQWMIKEIPVVRRGDDITLIVKGPNLLVRTAGEALMDGYLGRKIRVRKKGVTDPKKILEGVLISPKEVEVVIR
ncbi:MAG: flagellar basal body P-ring formation protein FlgA [Candidatus Saganbacteria bacterium]|nr:flagellar basal body P-ring formation protein FlgA [Candidatus Saganbacteria bacterium]